MKKFIKLTAIFLFLTIPITNIIPLVMIWTGSYKYTVAGNEIYYSIFKSKQKKKFKKLLIGDSVANQLFSNKKNYTKINSLCCNQAISLTGHYILINNYLSAGNIIDTVYMIFSPSSFQNNLNQIYTYHYFLKPFYTNDYKNLYTKTVNNQIEKLPFYYLSRYPYILTTNWAPNFETFDKKNYTFLSPISIEYLNKIKQLSVKYKFKLIFIPPPISLSKKYEIETINKNEICKVNLQEEFINYFNEIIYIDDTLFKDHIHLKKEYIETYSKYINDKFMK